MDESEILLKNFSINKTNPDWQIEEFWMTFKNQFYKLLNKNEKEEVDTISNKLNDFQRKKKYEQIQQYIVKQFDSIAIKVLKSEDKIINHSILPYFNKWDRISKFKFDKNNINFQLLKANDVLNNKEKTINDIIFQKLIHKYINSENKHSIIDEMVVHCIKSNQWHHFERIRSAVQDIEKYLKPETPEKLLKISHQISLSKLKNYFI